MNAPPTLRQRFLYTVDELRNDPTFTFWLGGVAGCLITTGAAYVWSFYL